MEFDLVWVAVLFGLAAVGGLVARIFKQPTILGYVAAGAVFAGMGGANSGLESMGKIGVTLLLFLVGLELPISEMKRVGRVAVVAGLAQIGVTTVLGYGLSRVLGFANLPALFLAIALCFSSTIVVVKLLSEKRDLQSVYGRVAVGLLLMQDFAAIGLFAVMSGIGNGGVSVMSLVGVVLKLGLLLGAVGIISVTVAKKAVRLLAASPEVLFVSALAWCLAMAAFSSSGLIGFSPEIGGFLAGLALANTQEHLHILSRIRPLRDFFLVMFFVWLGGSLDFGGGVGILWPAAVLSVFVLVIDPLVVMVILGLMGYRKRTGFLAGLTVAQISEFSLILLGLAYKFGFVDQSLLTITTLVGVVTMTSSSYMLMHGETLYRRLAKYLAIFERKKLVNEPMSVMENIPTSGHIILFGHNRIGSVIRPVLDQFGKPVVVVDFDPEIVNELKKLEVVGVYGDMGDVDLYPEIGLLQAELIVSTVPDIQDNLGMLRYVKANLMAGSGPTVVVTAVDTAAAIEMYRAGADYVLLPQSVGGEYLAEMLLKVGFKKTDLAQHGEHHRRLLVV